MILNQRKTKTIMHTLFKTLINNNCQCKTQKVSWWTVWVGDAGNIH